MTIESMPSPNHWKGRTQAIREILIHWWDDPAKNPSLAGTVAWLRNPASQVSAHYVVSGNRIIRLVAETNTAWHGANANPFTIGIEIDPNVPGNTYKTVGWLVNDIRKRRGNLPLAPHNKYLNTRCPGTISLARINLEAKGGIMAKFTKAQHKVLHWIAAGGRYPGSGYSYPFSNTDITKGSLDRFVQHGQAIFNKHGYTHTEVVKLRKTIKDLSDQLEVAGLLTKTQEKQLAELEAKLAEKAKVTTVELGSDTRSWIEKLIDLFRS